MADIYIPKEKYEPSSNLRVDLVYINYYYGQVFKALSDHPIDRISLKMARWNSPGTVYVSLRAVSGGLPAGGDLCSGSINGDTLTTDTNGAWYDIDMTEPYNAVEVSYYAIVIHAPGVGGTNQLFIRGRTPGLYDGGEMVDSSDSGATWDPDMLNSDLLFRVYSLGEPEEDIYHSGIKIRHPRICGVKMRRG